jgi:hypothetical protein
MRSVLRYVVMVAEDLFRFIFLFLLLLCLCTCFRCRKNKFGILVDFYIFEIVNQTIRIRIL